MEREDVNPATIGGSANSLLEDASRSGRLGRRTGDLSPVLSPGHRETFHNDSSTANNVIPYSN